MESNRASGDKNPATESSIASEADGPNTEASDGYVTLHLNEVAVAAIYEGTAAGRHHTEQQTALVGESFITDEREEAVKELVTDFVADPQSSWVGIDTSKAEFLWNPG
jgi:hypothetical protein